MRTKDPLLRAALFIQRRLEGHRDRNERPWQRTAAAVIEHARDLERLSRLSALSYSRHWTAAGGRLESDLAESLRHMHAFLGEGLNRHSRRIVSTRILLRDLHAELRQLHEEFERVDMAETNVIAAVTDTIELEGIYLGAYRIQLNLERLDEQADVSAFNIVALDPHPAAGSNDVTHPHVRDEQLCAGEATVPISNALREGRICDAFLAVNAVLHHYNSGSPYVSLGQWEGMACADCGQIVDEDHRYYCENCDQDFCDECFTSCDVCENSYCRGCLEEDRESGKSCCRGCRHTCGRCKRIVDSDSFVSDTGLCPGCHEQFLEEQQQEEVNDEEQKQDSGPETSAVGGFLPAPIRFLPEKLVLRFAPLAWLKLKTFLHADDVEVGGFGISATDDLLYVEDFVTVQQDVSSISIEFDDTSVADHVDRCVDGGIAPARCFRLWIHTHPGESASPSWTDEKTFKRVFGDCDWGAMIIVARGGECYVRLSFSAGPGGQVQIPLVVDWERLPEDLLDHEGKIDEMVSSWLDEYGRNICPKIESTMPEVNVLTHTALTSDGRLDSIDPLDDLYDQLVRDDDFFAWSQAHEEVMQ